MAQKLTLLIFSRNDVTDALELIKHLYEVADEIVVVDSSNRKLHEQLLRSKSRLKLEKLRIFYVVPLGYPDPIRMYALKKCRYDWVLLMDTDERLSDSGISSIKNIITDTDASAFALKRYENVSKGSLGSFNTLQIRLFRRSRTTFKGIVHEQPHIEGIVERPGDDIYIAHLAELRGRASTQYGKMEIFGRMSYGMFNERLMDYVNKVVLPRKGTANDTALGKAVKALLKTYQRIKLKGDQTELTNFDYLLYYFIVDLGYGIKAQSGWRLKWVFKNRKGYEARLREWKSSPDSREIFEISKVINTTGITKYLDLDNERTIERLNRRYGAGEGGVDLLIRLLKLRYEKGKKWLD